MIIMNCKRSSAHNGSRQSYTTNVPTVLSQKDVLLKDLSCLYLLNFLTNVRITHLKMISTNILHPMPSRKTTLKEDRFTSLKIFAKGTPCCWMLRVKKKKEKKKRSHIHKLHVLMFAFQIHYSSSQQRTSSKALAHFQRVCSGTRLHRTSLI